jgi:DNA-binding CsgD family transcriptional regulator/tetratricopeptide (TPR) repeat protein
LTLLALPGVEDWWTSMSGGSGVSRSGGQRPGQAAGGEPGELLERAESMATLDRLLDDVRSHSQGRLVLVGGEAGVGKTTLLLACCRRWSASARILWGRCEPLRTPRPLGPLLDVAEATGGQFVRLVEGVARPYEVAAGLIRELDTRGPTVLVLEDIHWADEATLDVLTLLAGRIASTPALVLATFRDDELGRADQLRVLLGEVVGRRGRLTLEPLSRAGVAELARGHGVAGDELFRRTQGNPFFVTEVLAAGGEHISETVRDAVLARAARLSAPARRLLDAVAVVPGTVDLSLLEAVAGELIDELEECLASGTLTAGQAHVAFRHELARLAIEEAMPPNRRLALHRAALAALASRGGEDPEVARLAHHAEAAGDREGVLRWAPAAAEQAARTGAHREAAAQYARALRFADGLPGERHAQLLARRVDECWMTDQFEAAVEAQQRALECRRELGDRRGEGDALRTLSRLLFFLGRVDEGERLAQEAVALLERLPSGHELAMAYGNLSQRRMVVEDVEETIAWGQRALDVAQSIHDTEALVYALTNIGAAEFDAGLDDGRLKLERALSLALNHGLEDYAGRAFPGIVRCAVRQRRFALATAYLQPGLEYCAERGLDTWRLYLLAARARLELHTGRWTQAADSAAEVLRDSRSAPFPRGSSMTVLGLLRARRGDPEPSAPLTEERDRAQPTGELDRIGSNAAARAEAAWLAGDDATAVAETEAAFQLAQQHHAPWVVGELACWRWRAGVRDTLAPGAVAEPYALSIAGEWGSAAELWRTLGCPYESALALADGGDPVALRQAVEMLRELGARPAAAIVTRRLRERGVRGVPRGPRLRTRNNPAGLTPRELEVVMLLAEGLRNAQIAQRLVVAEKTIDHHVSAILRKLDVHTRGEAAAEAVRLGLTDPR